MANAIAHTVQSGENLTQIAKIYANDLGLDPGNTTDMDDLIRKIVELNGIKNRDKIQAGAVLQIPNRDVQPISGQEEYMTDKKTIRVGSIIHLKNVFPDDEHGTTDGGYLETRGWITEKAVITHWHDPRIRGLVSTHQSSNRSMGSGSWQILSAEGKRFGAELAIGDKIYLLNMVPNRGYLDTFEWVRNLEPFWDYPMQIGVFTSSVPDRGGGPSGTWILQSAAGKAVGEKIVEGDSIYLKNDYARAGFLFTYGEVGQHDMFEEYEGQHFFVFTGPASPSERRRPPKENGEGSEREVRPLGNDSSHTWSITLNEFSEHVYRIQIQRGGRHAPWHNAGVFKIGDPSMKPIQKLSITSDDDGKTLSGSVTYQGEADPPIKDTIKATQREHNFYIVEILQGQGDTWKAVGEWKLGSSESQDVIRMDIEFDDDGHISTGKMTYLGQAPLRIRESTMPEDSTSRLYDYFQPDRLRRRTNKIEGVIDTTYTLLSTSFHGISTESLDQFIEQFELAEQNLDDVIEGVAVQGRNQDSVDHKFQIKQLLNLYALSENLNAFFRDTLQELIKRSLEHHQLTQTLPPFHLIRECFRHVATDNEIIQRAAVQRRWNQSLERDDNLMSEQAVELLVMDKLAINALTPFQHLLPDHPNRLTIITYLSERTHIHRVPYTKQCILVGVSYDRLPPAPTFFDDEEFVGQDFYGFELMAIPHEVGHYVYRHGTLDNGTTFPELSEQFETNPYYRWCEEIFADLYGCIVAGPLAVLSMQALLVSIDGDRAWNDDEEHPTPVLRLFILAEILRVLQQDEAKSKQKQVDDLARKLDTKWTKILEQWGYERVKEYEHIEGNRGKETPTVLKNEGRPSRVYLHGFSDLHLETIINVDRVMNAVRPMIIEFARHLLAAAKDAAAIPWSEPDKINLRDYYDVMAEMTGRDFAGKKIAQQNVLKINVDFKKPDLSDPDKILRQYLKEWGDRGPTGRGSH